ncbi:alpha/beta hydrolase [Spirillospora sp. NPDC052269]
MPFARGKVAYEVSGDGSPVLLHPGMFQIGAHWKLAGYTAALAARHTVITMDPLGLGDSEALLEPSDYGMERRAASVVAVLDDLGVERVAFWGYSMGALTGYAVAAHAPERLSRLVAGAFDPISGFRSAIAPTLTALGLPADTDPYGLVKEGAAREAAQADVIASANAGALRANYEAFAREPGAGPALAASGVRTLMYAGTADPWHGPMRRYAEENGAGFFSVADADHLGGWQRTAEVLAQVEPFLDE